MTDTSDKALLALADRLGWHREHPMTGKLIYANEDGPEAAAALRAIVAKRLREGGEG
jgi:hypothetical protein